MGINYCKWCGKTLTHKDILTGFCSDQCASDYDALLNAKEEEYAGTINLDSVRANEG